jgi:hypothetical protein
VLLKEPAGLFGTAQGVPSGGRHKQFRNSQLEILNKIALISLDKKLGF